jgi:hypothetical protein
MNVRTPGERRGSVVAINNRARIPKLLGQNKHGRISNLVDKIRHEYRFQGIIITLDQRFDIAQYIVPLQYICPSG